jgi:hypothetical protein
MNTEPNSTDTDSDNSPDGTNAAKGIAESKIYVPGWVFFYGGIILFIFGFFEMMEVDGVNRDRDLMMWFGVTFALAPAITIYPVMRFLFAPRTGLAIGLSALFGAIVQEIVKSYIKKHDK